MQVIATDDPFYVSGTFWAAAAVLASLLTGMAAVWATLRAANPKRSIRYSFEETELLVNHPHVDGSIEVLRDGVSLTSPRVVRLRIRNNGRRDIVAADFSQQRPIRASFGTPVLDILEPVPQPDDIDPPSVTRHGAQIRIAPRRFGSATETSYAVLVDGETTCELHHDLENVRVSEGIPLSFTTRLKAEVVFPMAVAAYALLLLIFAPFS
ncbi:MULTISPECIES: hypothetical protein [Streptomyces]|uniref:hypothetical protein n=1 Tax=Streptomyces TaxID=1883 RepID=UPI0021093E54|nr:hypothetical protein [Streptomyces longispororuber]MCQ4209872.1 hypothetical protein [Streptomyces longispororuber]